MILRHPFEISSRLLPSVRVGGAVVHLGLYKHKGGEYGKHVWEWFVDLPSGEAYCGHDFQGHGSTQSAFADLLGFLGACGEGVNYERRTGCESENAVLFPDAVGEWAAKHVDDLSILESIVEDENNLIEE